MKRKVQNITSMNKRRTLFFKSIFVVIICNPLPSKSQNIVIQTNHIALVYKIADTKKLVQLYFGERLTDTAEYSGITGKQMDAFPSGGSIYAREPGIEVTHSDGNPSLQLNYL